VPKDTLSVTDNRTGKQYEIPILDGGGTVVKAGDFRQIKERDDEFGMMTYDPAFMNTASCRSAISFIDGDRGILRYRGYPIEQLAEKSTFLETAYLLLHGELPSASELDSWVYHVTHHTIIHENIKKFIDGFHHDAHPMGMFVSAVAALSTGRSSIRGRCSRRRRRRRGWGREKSSSRRPWPRSTPRTEFAPGSTRWCVQPWSWKRKGIPRRMVMPARMPPRD
jgi:hypothetical protein